MRRLLSALVTVTVRGLAFVGFVFLVWAFLWLLFARGAPAPLGKPAIAKPKPLPLPHIGVWTMHWCGDEWPATTFAAGGGYSTGEWVGHWSLEKGQGGSPDLLTVCEAEKPLPGGLPRWETWTIRLDRWGVSGTLTTGGGFKLVEVRRKVTD